MAPRDFNRRDRSERAEIAKQFGNLYRRIEAKSWLSAAKGFGFGDYCVR
jgi:hypothetical protein